MEYLSIRNLGKYQRYTKRRPPWVKLHQTMLEDDALMRLPVTDRWVAVGLLLLASRTENRIVNDPEFLQHALHLPSPVDVTELLRIGYLVDADAVTGAHHLHTKRVRRVCKTGATCTPNAHPKSTEYRVQRTEKETTTTTQPAVAGEVGEILAFYTSLHPLRRPGERDRKLIERRLKTHTAQEITAAIQGNASDDWHRERGKHELEYILRDSKIDGFRLRPAPKPPLTLGDWLGDTPEIGPNGRMSDKWDLCTNPDRDREWARVKRELNIVVKGDRVGAA